MGILALSLLLILVQFGFLIVVVLAAAVVFAGTISVSLDVPYVPTPRRYYRIIGKALDPQKGDVVYELGSGDSGLLLFLARTFPEARFVGLEMNPVLFYFSRARIYLRGNPPNVSLRRENFFAADLSSADKFYGYLLGAVMAKLLPKLERETPRARFVSRAFEFKARKPMETTRLSKIPGTHGEHMLYVYDLTK